MRRSMLVCSSSPCCGDFEHLDFLDHLPAAVLDHAFRAVLARERTVIGKLEAFRALLVEVGEAEQVRRHLAIRVEALVFALRMKRPAIPSLRISAALSGSMWRAT